MAENIAHFAVKSIGLSRVNGRKPCTLLEAARQRAPWLPAQFGPGTRLKVYVRDRDDLPLVAAALEQRFGDRVPRVLLHAAICRRELSMEIDGVHG